MNSLREVPVQDFEAVLTDMTIRQFSIIQTALGVGVTMFGIVIGVLAATQEYAENIAAADLLQTLSYVHAFFFLGGISASRLAFEAQFSESSMTNIKPSSNRIILPAKVALARIRTAYIIRMALLEAPALFGLVICLLTVFNGLTGTHPIFLLNALSALFFLTQVSMTMPNKDRLLEVFKQKVRRDAA